jgi:raffinose/stachyose/melibiose transport system substrate-binding protein
MPAAHPCGDVPDSPHKEGFMKISRKALMLPALLVVVAVALASCGKQGPSASKPVELALLDSFLPNLSESYNVSLNVKIKDFEAKHPEVKLIRDQSSSDVLDTKVPTLGAANQLPDLFAARSSWTPKFADASEVLSIETLLKDNKAFMDGFIPGMLNDFQYKNAHYGIPWQAMPISVMYYNMNLLKKVGITKAPATFEEMLAAIKKLKAAGITPIAMGDKGKWQSRLLFSGLNVRTAGVDYLEKLKSGRMKFTDPPFKTTIDVFAQLAKAGAYNKDFSSIDYTQARALYFNQKVAMYNEMVTFAQIEDDQWPAELKGDATQFSFFPQLPGEDLGKGVAAPVATDWGIAFNSKLSGDKLSAAQAFAVEVLGDDYTKVLQSKGGIGVRKVEGVDYSKVPEAVKRYFDELAPKVLVGGHIDGRMPSAVTDAVSASLQNVMLGQETTEAAQKNIQTALEKALQTK